MNRPVLFCILWLASVPAAPARAQPPDATRGELLYATHCIECHTTRMHWRDGRQARDWETLKEQVRHWQGEARLQWSEQDIDAVARHLNDTIYRFPPPAQIGRAGGP